MDNSAPLLRAAIGIAAYLIFTLALFNPWLIDGHDSMTYPARLVEFARSGFPPLWAPDLSSGRGQPLFEFCPPLIYAVALPFWKIGCGLAVSLQLALAFLIGAGAASVYAIGRHLGFSQWASLAASVMWLYAPYQSIDLYVSVRMAEMSALCVASLGLYAMLAWPWYLAAFPLALLPLAHNAIALLMFPVLGTIGLLCEGVRGGWRRLLPLAAAALLDAWFWLPGLFEMRYVRPELLRTDFFDYHRHFIWLNQLVWGHWQFGYSPLGMDYSLGLPHITLAIGGLLYAGRDWLHTPERSYRDRIIGREPSRPDWLSLPRLRRGTPAQRSTALACCFAGASLAGAFLATGYSVGIWDRLPILQYFQFPWRTLALPALFMPLLSLWAFEAMFHLKQGVPLIIMTIGLVVVANIGHAQSKGYINLNDAYFTPSNIAASGWETTTRGEYGPRDEVAREYLKGPTAIRRIGKGISLCALFVIMLAIAGKWNGLPYLAHNQVIAGSTPVSATTAGSLRRSADDSGKTERATQPI